MAIILSEIFEGNTIKEDVGGVKKYGISGIFMQAEQRNRNNRIYPKHLMEREVAKYNVSHVQTKKAMGELNHPANRVSVDPREASHLITKLEWDDNNVIGEAKILNTPCGKIVKALMDEDICFGVSSRALGSTKKRSDGINEVSNDFDLRTIDIVSDPSAHDAWMTAIMENKEWVLVEGVWTEQNIQETKSIIRKATKAELNEKVLSEWTKFMNSLRV